MNYEFWHNRKKKVDRITLEQKKSEKFRPSKFARNDHYASSQAVIFLDFQGL